MQSRYNFIYLLAMIYILSIITGFIFIAKEIYIPYLGGVSAGAFILPFSFPLIDCVAEIYGYRTARQIIWYGIIAQGFFCLVVFLLLKLPADTTNQNFATQGVYNQIFGILPRVFLSTTIASFIGIFINAYLITRWKFLLKGRYFWLRSLGASTIGEAVFTLIAVLLICIGRYSWHEIMIFFFISYLAKIMTTLICCYPSALFVSILKIIEKPTLDASSKYINYNPFINSNAEEPTNLEHLEV